MDNIQEKVLNTKKNERDSNIELLRIVLMIMVILHHTITKMPPDNWNKTVLFMGINTFAIIAVDCFIFISGYYGIKFKLKSLISFLLQGIFYSVVFYIIYNRILSPENFSWGDLAKRFFPITFPIWWFFSAFIGVYLLSPFINKGIESLKAYQSGGIILILLYLSSSYVFIGSNFYSGGGYGFFTMLFVYMIARYCGKYIKNIPKALPLYIGVYLLTAIIVIGSIAYGKEDFAWRLISYNSIVIILAAIFYFYIFHKIKLKSRIINKIAPLTFGIYLIHETPENRIPLKAITTQLNTSIENPVLMAIGIIAIAITVFVICAAIEKIRQVICNPVVDIIDKKVSVVVSKFKNITPLN